MQVQMEWKGRMRFDAGLDGHTVSMDAKSPLGADQGPSPKQLALAGMCGCTAMDVIALLKKYKQNVESFSIEAEAPQTETHPRIFAKIHLKYMLKGQVEREKALAAVHLSMSQYCGVSAMFSKSVPISYDVLINNEVVGSGKAEFA